MFIIFRYQTKNGRETRADKIFEIGWQSSSPVMPKKWGRVKIKGIKKIPCLQLERKILFLFSPPT